MAKETGNAAIICLILTIITIIGIIAGLKFNKPLIISAILILPAVYEVYRTEGFFTKIFSLAILGIIFAEVALIAGKINTKLIDFVKSAGADTAGLKMPAVDLKTAGAVAGALLSIFLLKRTGGKYTIWLAAILFAGMLSLAYVMNTELFNQILNGNFMHLIKNIR